MARFSVGDDDSSTRKRKQRPKTDWNLKKLYKTGEEEAKDETLNQDQEGSEEEREGEHDEDEAEEEEEERVREGSVESCGSGGAVTVRIDLDVLDCTICLEPLSSPIFQCRNGHVACSSCCSKLGNKCHSCSDTIGYSRCLALEKIIESVKIPCSNAIYGCRETVSYPHKHTHEGTCIHMPCSCPMRDCSFRGSTRMLSSHISRIHNHSAKSFFYDLPFKVSFEQTKPLLVLHAEDSHLFVLFNNSGESSSGYALSVACIRPRTQEWDFSYELTVNNKGDTLQVRASTTNIQEKLPDNPAKVFLMVPAGFFSCGKIYLDVCIRKKRSSFVN